MPVPPRPAGSAWPAIAQVIAGVLLFSVSDALAKLLRESLPAVEIAWLRYLIFVLFGLALTGRRRFAGLWPRRPGLQILRGVALVGSAVLFVAGLSYLQIAEASAISFVSPAFITALSVLFLGEQVGIRRWTATLVGLLGVLIVIRPGAGAFQLAALFPLASAACWAVVVIVTRVMGTQDRSETTLFWSAGVGLLLLTALLPLGITEPTPTQMLIGVVLGIAASGGQYLMILAYRRAPASLLAPFSYVQLLSSAALGYLLFGSVPDAPAFLGAAVIVASGLYIVHRERVRAREARTAAIKRAETADQPAEIL
ncbi:MAG TPA: DMT family transporter [Acetobacteraceae bacterium]|nr:DMT family transporter [Acetobacteraceae bacterium]